MPATIEPPLSHALVCESVRLRVRHLTDRDAAFIVELLNDADFLHYIGDRGVRTPADALSYLRSGPYASYEQHGFGLFAVELKLDATPVGLCGILKRDYLDSPDLGYAFLQRFRGAGLADEAGRAVLRWARQEKRLTRILAITAQGNGPSARVLARLGFRREGQIPTPGHPEGSLLFVLD